MKKILTRIFLFILAFAVLAGSFAGSYSIHKSKTTRIEPYNLSAFYNEPDKLYLKKVDSNIIFYINADTTADYNSLFELVDYNNNIMNPKIREIKKGQFCIMPPDNGYIKGERYTLSLREGAVFDGDELKKARTLVLLVDKEFVEKYTFTDNVREIKDEKLQFISEEKIRLPEGKFKKGDILFGKNEKNEYAAYKIKDLIDSDTAVIEIPKLDEIYSELEVNGEYKWSVNDIVANPQLESEIVKNIKNSSFYNKLLTIAYAASTPPDDTIKLKIKADPSDNSLEIEIAFELEPGKVNLLDTKDLADQKIMITLKRKIGLTLITNIKNPSNMDVSAVIEDENAWTMDVTLEHKKESQHPLEELFKGDSFTDRATYQNNVRIITEKLNNIQAEAVSGDVKLFNWTLLIPEVPGLKFDTEVKFTGKLSVAAELCVGHQNKTVSTVGLAFYNGEYKPYSSLYDLGSGDNVSFKGKQNSKIGLKLEFNMIFIDEKIAKIGISPEIGLYEELFVTFPILTQDDVTKDNFMYSYFEPGWYFRAILESKINLVAKEFKFQRELLEKKFPFEGLKLGNDKISLGISTNTQTVRAINNTISLPEILFKYYDVKKGRIDSEILSADKIKIIASDGKELPVNDGKVTLPAASNSSSVFYNASYKHSDGKTYSTVIRALLSGSMIEGRVSAYSNDTSSSSTIAGATIKIYKANDITRELGTTTTDENGKFNFTVSEGEFAMIINANGYKELKSFQSIGNDEIKYTEHILLIDNNQSGMGTAGGTVNNAIDGRNLGNVTLKLRKDWNNKTGEYIQGFETKTNSDGKYSVSGVPVGYYTIEAQKDGFYTDYCNIIVQSSNPKIDNNFTISPVLPDNQYRVVLRWGQYPNDLDSHLIGKNPDGNPFNIYYSDKRYSYSGVEIANLDVDDTTSYGPETVTILQPISGRTIYAVHDYTNKASTNSNKLSYSGAVVTVFKGGQRVATYNVPTGQVGTYWNVFIFNNGQIMPVNSISNTKPTI